MTEASARDIEMAMEIFRNLSGGEAFALPAVAQALADAREEGRQEERALGLWNGRLHPGKR